MNLEAQEFKPKSKTTALPLPNQSAPGPGEGPKYGEQVSYMPGPQMIAGQASYNPYQQYP